MCRVFNLILWYIYSYLTGMVDKRTLEKYEREAKEKNRETWWVLLLQNCVQ